MFEILDPTLSTARDAIAYAPRPSRLAGLRVGLVENTKPNAEAVLQAVAAKLAVGHGMSAPVLIHKPQRAPLTPAQVAGLKDRVDFAIAGVGD